MTIIASDHPVPLELATMLEGFDCPAILVSAAYKILATNSHYQQQFGQVDLTRPQHCYEVSHGYGVPCDQAGEDCPLASAKASKHKERVLHIHQTPRGREYVDVEMVPLHDRQGQLLYFIELLKPVPMAGIQDSPVAMVGASESFNRMLAKITRVSHANASVLLLGESGTGKELAASAIHGSSARKDKALVTLECAGLSDSLFESELFGHVKGAFTGANSNKKGLVELADGGTLFLDEIGDVPLSMQVKLLRLLETGVYRAVGSAETKTSDFRLVCATHKNLFEMVAAGHFREDLFYRINVFPIEVPALRERIDDLPFIIKSLLSRLSADKEYYLTESAMQLLRDYAFPGNIRELRNFLSRAIVLTDTNLIDREVMEECMLIDHHYHNHRQGQGPSQRERLVDLQTLESQYLQELMQIHHGDKDRVAEIAGISTRSLYRKLKAH